MASKNVWTPPNEQARPAPPRLLAGLLRLTLPRRDRDVLLADLAELFRYRAQRDGRLRATAWYTRHAFVTPLRLLVASDSRVAAASLQSRISNPPRDALMIETIWQDMRFALRTLGRSPMYVAVVVLTLTIGVGINATIFTMVNALLLRPLPVLAPEELVEIYSFEQEYELPITSSYPDYRSISESATTISGVAGHAMLAANMTSDGSAEMVYGEFVTGNFFELLGITPHLGRLIGDDDDRIPGGHPVVVLGHGFWRDRFAADEAIIGEALILNGRPYTVIGIAPPEFNGLVHVFDAQLWLPTMMADEIDPFGVISVQPSPGDTRPEQRGARWMMIKGRLAEGAGVEQVQAELEAIFSRLTAEYPDSNDGWGVRVLPATSVRVHPMADGYLAPVAALLLGMVGLVLISACTNIAAMTLSRASARSREIAVRVALGAGKARLVRQLLTESLALAFLGGVGGVGLTFWLRGLLLRFRPPSAIPMSWNLPVDGRVIAFTFALAVAAGLIFGLAPALRGSRTDLVAALKEGARGSEGSGRKLGLRGALVVVQVAVCVVLLVGAALMVRSAQSAKDVDLGFDPNGLLTYSVDMDLLDYSSEDADQFFDTAVARIGSLPGVRSVARADRMPLSLGLNQNGMYIEGRQVTPDDPGIPVDTTRVDGAYFDALGVPLLRGRTFGAQDTAESPRVVVVSMALAERDFPGGAVGQTFHTGGLDGTLYEIVGVVADTKVRTVGEEPIPYLYYADEQSPRSAGTFAVRLGRDTPQLRAAVRQELLAIEPELVFTNAGDMLGILSVALFPVRFGAGMLISAGVIALLLVSVGLYGVIAYSVARRAKEIGVRMALGAASNDVHRLILGRGLRLVAIGAAVGGLAAALLSRALASVLYGIGALDPLAFGAAFLVLLLVSGLANWLPARRAARLDPVEALRTD